MSGEQGHVEVEISADPALLENLPGILFQLGFEGFWEAETTLRCYIKASRWSPKFFEEVQTIVHIVARSSKSPLPQIRTSLLPGQNWNALWEKTITPIHVSDRITVRPSWHDVQPREDEIVLTIDPKMSFGTGYHESTRLVLRLLEPVVRPGMRMLDVGTGTGILAIAGVRLGCASACGCDIDEWSHQNAIENARLNGVTDRCTFLHGGVDVAPRETFDIVAANIQLNVILSIVDDLCQRCAPTAHLLLSGLLLQDETEIAEALSARGFATRRRLTENEWLGLDAGHFQGL